MAVPRKGKEHSSVSCFDDGWFYGVDAAGESFRMSADGSVREIVDMGGLGNALYKGHLYFHDHRGVLNGQVVGSIFVRNLEDGSQTLLHSGYCFSLSVASGWLFYSEYDKEKEKAFRWRIPIDGGTPVKIA
jgi:hypothetical protein